MQLAAELAEALERAFLIQAGQPGVSRHIGGQDGGKLARRAHGTSGPAWSNAASLTHDRLAADCELPGTVQQLDLLTNPISMPRHANAPAVLL